jgi:hypothetical protein
VKQSVFPLYSDYHFPLDTLATTLSLHIPTYLILEGCGLCQRQTWWGYFASVSFCHLTCLLGKEIHLSSSFPFCIFTCDFIVDVTVKGLLFLPFLYPWITFSRADNQLVLCISMSEPQCIGNCDHRLQWSLTELQVFVEKLLVPRPASAPHLLKTQQFGISSINNKQVYPQYPVFIQALTTLTLSSCFFTSVLSFISQCVLGEELCVSVWVCVQTAEGKCKEEATRRDCRGKGGFWKDVGLHSLPFAPFRVSWSLIFFSWTVDTCT